VKLLYVCSRNQWRSKTAESLFRGRPGIEVRSAGTAASARVKVSQKLLDWADAVFVMERDHAAILRKRFGFRDAKCLEVPDEYEFMDPDLVELLEAQLEGFLSSTWGAPPSRLGP